MVSRMNYINNNSVYRAIEFLMSCPSAEVHLKSQSDNNWLVTNPQGVSISYKPNDTAGVLTQFARTIFFIFSYVFSSHFRASMNNAFKKLEDAAPKAQESALKVKKVSIEVLDASSSQKLIEQPQKELLDPHSDQNSAGLGNQSAMSEEKPDEEADGDAFKEESYSLAAKDITAVTLLPSLAPPVIAEAGVSNLSPLPNKKPDENPHDTFLRKEFNHISEIEMDELLALLIPFRECIEIDNRWSQKSFIQNVLIIPINERKAILEIFHQLLLSIPDLKEWCTENLIMEMFRLGVLLPVCDRSEETFATIVWIVRRRCTSEEISFIEKIPQEKRKEALEVLWEVYFASQCSDRYFFPDHLQLCLCEALIDSSNEIRERLLKLFNTDRYDLSEFFQQFSKEQIREAIEVLCTFNPIDEKSYRTSSILLEIPRQVRQRVMDVIAHIQSIRGLNAKTYTRLAVLWSQLVIFLEQAAEKGDIFHDEIKVEDVDKLSERFLNLPDKDIIYGIAPFLPPTILPQILWAAAEWRGDANDFFRIVMRHKSESRKEIIQHWNTIFALNSDEEITQLLCYFLAENYGAFDIDPSSSIYKEMIRVALHIASKNELLTSFKSQVLEGIPNADAIWERVVPILLMQENKTLDYISNVFANISFDDKAELIIHLVPYLISIEEDKHFQEIDIFEVISVVQKIPTIERAEALSLIKPFFQLTSSILTFYHLLQVIISTPQPERTYVFSRAFSRLKSSYWEYLDPETLITVSQNLLSSIASCPLSIREDVFARTDRFLIESKTKKTKDVLEDSSEDSTSEESGFGEGKCVQELSFWTGAVKGLGYFARSEWSFYLETMHKVLDSDASTCETVIAISVLLPSQTLSKTIDAVSKWGGSQLQFFRELMEKDPLLREEIVLGWVEILRSDQTLRAKLLFDFIVLNHEVLGLNSSDPLVNEVVFASSRLVSYEKHSSVIEKVLKIYGEEEKIKVQADPTRLLVLQQRAILAAAADSMKDLSEEMKVRLLVKILPHFLFIRDMDNIEKLMQQLMKIPPEQIEDVLVKLSFYLNTILQSFIFYKEAGKIPPEGLEGLLKKAYPAIENIDQSTMRFDEIGEFDLENAGRSFFKYAGKYLKVIAAVPHTERSDVLEKVDCYLTEIGDREETADNNFLSYRYIKQFYSWSNLVKYASCVPQNAREGFLVIMGYYLRSPRFHSIASLAMLIPPHTWLRTLEAFATYHEEYEGKDIQADFFKTIMDRNTELWKEIEEGWFDILESEETPQTRAIDKFIKTLETKFEVSSEDERTTQDESDDQSLETTDETKRLAVGIRK